jgi:hypothetical protein
MMANFSVAGILAGVVEFDDFQAMVTAGIFF